MNFIFDLGNVLIDWNPEKFIAGFELSDEEKRHIEAELFGHADWLALDKGTKGQQEVIANVAERSGMSQEIVKYCIAQMKQSLVTIERSAALVHQLHKDGHGLYCLSNMSHDSYAHIKDRDFFGCFTDIIISAEIKMIKPDLEIFEYTLGKFGLKAEESLFIDDSEPNIMAAKSLNINCVHFKRTPNCYDEIISYI
ncbi:MAG: HAD family phosphatase [Alphaproteobacteria bacterium]|nr:HAD family phosphatase [Alphaproteobacteria bacterium]